MCVLLLIDCITLLLKYGADPQFTDHNGNTPLDLAKDKAARELLQKVLRHNETYNDNSGTINSQAACPPPYSLHILHIRHQGSCLINFNPLNLMNWYTGLI